MIDIAPTIVESAPRSLSLQTYLLGTIEFDAALRLQRRLVYDVAGDRSSSSIVVCEHPPTISVGRDGSRTHIRIEPAELRVRGWPIRWVNRGGGCLLHVPGQIAAYVVAALDIRRIDVRSYLDRLHAAAARVVQDFDVSVETPADRPGVWADGRLLGHVGIAVRDWIAYFGLCLNVNPDLAPFRYVDCAGSGRPPMTSLERERRGAVRHSAVRQRLIEELARGLECDRVALFHSHPALAAADRRRPCPVGS